MSEEQKKDIKEMVEILGKLDREDLLLIKGGATMLATRKELAKSKVVKEEVPDEELINP